MNSNIFIPKKINVGFQNRSDTYTKKLAYVIYFDEKNVLRKEKSWSSWRDNKIPNEIFDNIPTEGFVLNKHVGGYSSGWEHRNSYTRVYDPRGFEFEITIENLLYILENATSTKGKGLEGLFVYGWDGKDLILIPCESPDYKEMEKLNNLRYSAKKYSSKDLIIGATYKDTNNRNLIYMGKFYESNKDKSESKTYFFYDLNTEYKWNKHVRVKSLSNFIIDIIDEKCIENYADLFDELKDSGYYSERDPKKDEYKYYTLKEFTKRKKDEHQSYFFMKQANKINRIYIDKVHQWSGYYNREEKYNVWTLSRGCKDEKILEELRLEQIFEKIKPMYLITYKSNGELIKEWKGNE